MRMFVFKAMLKERGITQETIAALLGISTATVRRRFRDGSFRAGEIAMISRALGLSDKQVCAVFFDTKVAQRKQ